MAVIRDLRIFGLKKVGVTGGLTIFRLRNVAVTEKLRKFGLRNVGGTGGLRIGRTVQWHSTCIFRLIILG